MDGGDVLWSFFCMNPIAEQNQCNTKRIFRCEIIVTQRQLDGLRVQFISKININVKSQRLIESQ